MPQDKVERRLTVSAFTSSYDTIRPLLNLLRNAVNLERDNCESDLTFMI